MTSTLDQLQQQINDIEAELGVTPEGIYASVRTRLDILEARINNPFAPAPSVNNPFYIGNTGVSIQTGFGDPGVLLVPAIPGSLWLREDGYLIDSLYTYAVDGLWHAIGAGGLTFGGDLSGSASTQKVIGIQGIPVSATAPLDGYLLSYSSSLGQWLPRAPGSRALSKSTSYGVQSSDGDIFVSISSSALTMTLPAVPFLGEKHGFKDVNDLANTFNITLAGNGKQIEQFTGGTGANLVISQNGASVVAEYNGTFWSIV